MERNVIPDYILTFLTGAAFMLCILGTIVHDGPLGKTYKHATELITECENTLPRNEQCTLIAIPVSKN